MLDDMIMFLPCNFSRAPSLSDLASTQLLFARANLQHVRRHFSTMHPQYNAFTQPVRTPHLWNNLVSVRHISLLLDLFAFFLI